MKKTFKILIALAMVSSMFTVTAHAQPLKFYVTKSMGVKTVQTNTKDISGSTFWITNSNTSYSNFVENDDVIGFKVKDYTNYKIGQSMSSYHKFSKFVDWWPLKYTSVPKSGQDLALNTQVDSASKHSTLKIEGAWYA